MRRATHIAIAVGTALWIPLNAARAPAVEVLGSQTGDSLARGRALHALNRLTYGPRPGDVDRVVAMGVERFIDQQLHPERLPDSLLRAKLADYQILKMSGQEVFAAMRAERQARRRRPAPPSDGEANRAGGRRMEAGRADGAMAGGDASGESRSLVTEFYQLPVVRAVLSERQLYEVMVDFWTNHFNVFVGKGWVMYLAPTYIEHAIRPHALGKFEDLLIATAKSPAMLYYLDNMMSIANGAEPPSFGRMRRQFDQLQGRARRGDRSAADQVSQIERRMDQARQRIPSGLNENYARELLELHTLGVDGGYTQQDVVEVARILTGWGIDAIWQGGTDFEFHDWAHDRGSKVVMGREFPAGRGMEEGVTLLRWLASHPSTMRFVGGKLCAKFVADDPPAGCIDAAARAWQASDGDIREVLAAIFRSEEFWAPRYRGAKTKTPLEFVAGATRALDADLVGDVTLPRVVRRLGQPLYGHEAPTGYPEEQADWVSAGALLNRLNVVLGMASSGVPGLRVNLDRVAPVTPDVEKMIASINASILNNTASPNTLRVLREQAGGADEIVNRRAFLVGLALGSPEFQRQ